MSFGDTWDDDDSDRGFSNKKDDFDDNDSNPFDGDSDDMKPQPVKQTKPSEVERYDDQSENEEKGGDYEDDGFEDDFEASDSGEQVGSDNEGSTLAVEKGKGRNEKVTGVPKRTQSKAKVKQQKKPTKPAPKKEKVAYRPKTRPKGPDMTEEEVAEMQQKNTQLRAEINSIKRDLKRLQPAILQTQELESVLHDRQRQNKTLSIELSTLEKSLGEIKKALIQDGAEDGTVPSLEREKTELRDSIKETEKELAEKSAELKQNDTKNIQLQNQIKTQEKQIAELCARIQVLQPDNWKETIKGILGADFGLALRTGDIGRPQQRYASKSSQNEAEIASLKKRIRDTTSNKTKTLEDINSKVEKTKKDISKTKENITRLQRHIDSKDKEIRLLFLQITGLTSQSSVNTRGIAPI
ncbi:hypothetical protein BLNAU_2609 [Blattamonas nauphoetae]|uniref:Uncharacterized protein n=1 Tax=Blattamonas nauphoetae TaxID=2049346 RepID=A0ABQ9YF16_9EUKA|nr:hypothetical protein BLNAU_2609 [Blattamonas nauphoetae]